MFGLDSLLKKAILCTAVATIVIGFSDIYAPTSGSCGVVSGPMYFLPLDPSANATSPSSSFPPTPPISPSATAVSSSQINLLWGPSSGATYYRIERWTYPTCAVNYNPTTTATSHQNTDLAPNTTYYYRIGAVNAAGMTLSSVTSATTLSPPPQLPNAPTGLQASASSSQISLSWTASSGATSYRIDRSTSSSSDFTTIATVSLPSHADSSGLTASTTYYYRVYAINGAGTSTSYVATSAITLAEPSQPIESVVPSWIKELAGWWADGSVDDDSFVNAIKWLIENNIIRIAGTTSGSDAQSEIPSWVKTTANWWSEGMVSDNEFVSAIQYLIRIGVITISN